MNRKEFYEKSRGMIDAAIEDKMVILQKVNSLEKKLNTNVFSKDYIETDIKPQYSNAKKELKMRGEIALASIRDLSEKYIAELKEEDTLKGELLTDDVKLLNMGIVLSSEDLEMLFDRNEGNSTMQKVIVEYASQNDVKISRQYIPSNAVLIENVKAVPEIANNVIKWFDKTELYNEVIGEGSNMYNYFTKE